MYWFELFNHPGPGTTDVSKLYSEPKPTGSVAHWPQLKKRTNKNKQRKHPKHGTSHFLCHHTRRTQRSAPLVQARSGTALLSGPAPRHRAPGAVAHSLRIERKQAGVCVQKRSLPQCTAEPARTRGETHREGGETGRTKAGPGKACYDSHTALNVVKESLFKPSASLRRGQQCGGERSCVGEVRSTMAEHRTHFLFTPHARREIAFLLLPN